MTTIKLSDTNNLTMPFNWPVVGSLLFLTGIAGIPAAVMLVLVLMSPTELTGIYAFVNPIHFQAPTIIFLHGGSGVLFFLTMPFQFSQKLRAKHLGLHKTTGRIAIVSAYVMAISGIWMHNLLSPESQGIRYYLLIFTSFLICLTFSIALIYAIRKNIAQHKKWMARSVAITLAAVTPLFIDTAIAIGFSQYPQVYALLNQFQYDYGRLLAVAINLAIVEVIWHKQKATSLTQCQA